MPSERETRKLLIDPRHQAAGCASSHAWTIACTSSRVSGSTGFGWNLGGWTRSVGSSILNSVDAHAKNEDRNMYTLRIVLPESGSLLPPNRAGLYSVRSQAR